MGRYRIGRAAGVISAALVLSGCTEGTGFQLFPPKESAANATAPDTSTTRLIERDVEAPDVFQASETGLWDGRPSLGGVWVAYPGVAAPERVIIRNDTNGKFVIGALFNRERENPGPKLQVSADAASALGLLAGQPTALNVTALRKEEVPVAPPPKAKPPAADAPATAAASKAIDTQPIEPLAAAAAAIDKAEGKTAPAAPVGAITPAAPAATATVAVAAPAAKPKTSGLTKPFIQIGIFSVKENADRSATALRGGGIVPTVLKGESSGKTFWRVIVGPAGSSAERATLLKKIKGLGYSDAYFVTN